MTQSLFDLLRAFADVINVLPIAVRATARHAILVAAGGPEIPPPLVEQLAPGGRMIIPLGAKGAQTLTLVRRTPEGIRTSPIGEARFVPLVGEHGFDA